MIKKFSFYAKFQGYLIELEYIKMSTFQKEKFRAWTKKKGPLAKKEQYYLDLCEVKLWRRYFLCLIYCVYIHLLLTCVKLDFK